MRSCKSSNDKDSWLIKSLFHWSTSMIVIFLNKPPWNRQDWKWIQAGYKCAVANSTTFSKLTSLRRVAAQFKPWDLTSKNTLLLFSRVFSLFLDMNKKIKKGRRKMTITRRTMRGSLMKSVRLLSKVLIYLAVICVSFQQQ